MTEDRDAGNVLLLRSLLNRLDKGAEAARTQSGGVVSDAEREALRALLRAKEGAELPTGKPIESQVPLGENGAEKLASEAASTPPSAAVELDETALKLDASPKPDWVLCLDFGTAKSKAFAATGDEDALDLRALAIGAADEDRDGAVYDVASSVWITDDGLLFVGSQAVKRSMEYGGEREALHSLKQEISQVDAEDGAAKVRRILPRKVDPGATLTYGDAITIYLAYLTDLATTEIASDKVIATRYVRRRFTVPAWKETHRRWAAGWIGTCLLRAQVLADTFHGRWRNGIPVRDVKDAVRAVAKHDRELAWMAATESGDASDWGSGILEALAAASARLWTDGSARHLMLVVDVGAGTTDLSLFLVVQDQKKERALHSAWPAEGAVAVGVRQAGDTLDDLLVQVLIEKAGLVGHQAGDRARQFLRPRARLLKQTLFKGGRISPELPTDGEVTLSKEEFVGSPGVQRFSEFIAGKIQQLLDGVDPRWGELAELHGLTMVLTGGGYELPMITGLAERAWRLGECEVRVRLAPTVPDGVADRFSQEFQQEYPRLAVAMGGALPLRLDEKSPMPAWLGRTGSPGQLDKFPIQGV